MSDSRGEESKFTADFEVFTEMNEDNLNEATDSLQNESASANLNSSEEVSAREVPLPKPRKKTKDSPNEIQITRESEWNKKKDELLGEIADLKEELSTKNEEAQLKYKEYEERIEELEKNANDGNEALSEQHRKDQEKIEELEREGEESKRTEAELQRQVQEILNEKESYESSLTERNESFSKVSEEIAVLQSEEAKKDEIIQALREELRSITQQKDEECRKADQLGLNNVEIQNKRAELEAKLAKWKELYDELSTINDEHEKKQNENTRELEYQKKEIEQLVQAKSDVMHQLQKATKDNRDLKEEMGKLNNKAHGTQSQKDQLESELVAVKLEQRRCSSEMQKSAAKVDKLETERDFYIAKCKELEQGLKLKADDEISKLTKGMDELNKENKVLRSRNLELERDVSLLNAIKNDLEAARDKSTEGSTPPPRSSDRPSRTSTEGSTPPPRPSDRPSRTSSGKKSGRSNGKFDGKSSGRSNPVRTDADEATGQRQKQVVREEPMNTSEQWYESDEGAQLIRDIYQGLKTVFNNDGSIEMSRDVTSQDISLNITTEQRHSLVVRFPRNFPTGEMVVEYRGTSRKLFAPYNRNAPSELAGEVVKMLSNLASNQSF